mmetsp:Transcript_17252/g.41323  ORF Transcript_17252/g.41323 Transcript_17252/m.41323 type:complete len:271 (+) Transcript_17252:682-1494(+)
MSLSRLPCLTPLGREASNDHRRLWRERETYARATELLQLAHPPSSDSDQHPVQVLRERECLFPIVSFSVGSDVHLDTRAQDLHLGGGSEGGSIGVHKLHVREPLKLSVGDPHANTLDPAHALEHRTQIFLGRLVRQPSYEHRPPLLELGRPRRRQRPPIQRLGPGRRSVLRSSTTRASVLRRRPWPVSVRDPLAHVLVHAAPRRRLLGREGRGGRVTCRDLRRDVSERLAAGAGPGRRELDRALSQRDFVAGVGRHFRAVLRLERDPCSA